jgi:hypothetical protein
MEYQHGNMSQEDLDAAINQGNLIGTINLWTGSAAEYLSYLASFLSLDNSGNMFKFSQMAKILTKFRLLNINYGLLLTSYFRYSSLKYDPPSDKGMDYIRLQEDGSKAKFTTEQVELDLVAFLNVKFYIYVFSWILKIFSFKILRQAQAENSITKARCYFVHFSQKIHFVSFNIVAISMLTYGLRNIFHIGPDFTFTKFVNILVLSLFIVDLCQIFVLTKNYFLIKEDGTLAKKPEKFENLKKFKEKYLPEKKISPE